MLECGQQFSLRVAFSLLPCWTKLQKCVSEFLFGQTCCSCVPFLLIVWWFYRVWPTTLLLPSWLPFIMVLMHNDQSLIVNNSHLLIMCNDCLVVPRKICNWPIYGIWLFGCCFKVICLGRVLSYPRVSPLW